MNEAQNHQDQKIWDAFGLSPPIDDDLKTIPRNTVYQTKPENVTSPQKLSSGGQVSDGQRVFWGNARAKCEFEAEGNDLNFSFRADPGDYFSLSWALGDVEIDQLTSMHLMSVSVEDILGSDLKPIQSKIYGKMVFVKNTFEVSYETTGNYYRNRLITGFSLENEDIQFATAHRLWIDFIISKPPKKFTMIDPRLIVQNRILI